MPRLPIAAFLVTLCLATAAAAGGDVCLFDDDNNAIFHFSKPKAPKSIGASAPLVGVGLLVGLPAPLPLSGAVTRLDAETLVVGFTRYGQFCVVAGTLDPDLSGSFSYDCNLDGVIDESSDVVEVDCDQL